MDRFRERQRQDPALASVPVVLLSGEGNLAQIAARLGVASYFHKPVEFGGLLDAIRVLTDGQTPTLPTGWPLQRAAAATECCAGASA